MPAGQLRSNSTRPTPYINQLNATNFNKKKSAARVAPEETYSLRVGEASQTTSLGCLSPEGTDLVEPRIPPTPYWVEETPPNRRPAGVQVSLHWNRSV